MNKIFKVFLSVLLLVTPFMVLDIPQVEASTPNPESDFLWRKESDGTAMINDYLGESKNVVIPDRLGGLIPKRIETIAFSTKGLESVVIPEGVEEIIDSDIPFMGGPFSHNNITHVVLPNSLKIIGDGAFIFNNLKELVIPNGVERIGAFAFYANNLEKIFIPDNVKIIDAYAFGDEGKSLIIYGKSGSKAELYANEYGHVFIDSDFWVSFSVDGNSTWSTSHSTTVKVFGSGLSKLEYIWSTSTSFPTSGFTTASIGSNINTPKNTGNYYLHIKATDKAGKVQTLTSNVFKVDNTNPTLTLSPSPTGYTSGNVTISASGSDTHSGVKRIQKPDGAWVNESNLVYEVSKNGTYSFTIEDNAGNITTKSIAIDNIDRTISFINPTIGSFGDITLKETPTTYSTYVTPITIKDWRDSSVIANNWRLEVSATPLKMINGSYTLPSGTIVLNPLFSISKVSGEGTLPRISMANKKSIDNGKVTVAEGKNSRGEFNLQFPQNALELLVDPTTVKINKNETNGTKYETTISWDIVTAP